MQFWQPYQKFFSKKPQICHSGSKKGRQKLSIFWKEDSFSSNCASAHVESICDHRVKNLSSKISKLFARIPDRMKNLCAFQTKLFLSKMFVWTCAIENWQACRNLVAKKTKNFPELQKCWSYNFSNKFIFFSINDSLATEHAVLATVANIFFWESTDWQLRFRKPRKKTELFERRKTFIKIFLCTCKMQLWPPCRKFLVKTLKFFCWISRNEEKLISLPKKLFLKIFVWTCTTNFWQACRNNAAKNTENLFVSKSQKDSNAIFFEKTNFSFSSFLQKIKKSSSRHAESSCDHRVKNLSSKISKLFARIPDRMKNLCAFQTKLFLSKMFVWTCAIENWQACRNLVAKKTKNFPELQKCWSYNFSNKFIFFHQKWFFSNAECSFGNGSKHFFLRIHRLAAQIPKTTKKNWTFRKEKNFLKNLPMYM